MMLDERRTKEDDITSRWAHLWKRHNAWFGVLLSGLLVAICYGYVLRLPFFFDDLPHMTWLSGHSLADIWSMSSENIYFRPLAMTIYKLGQLLPKGTQQVVSHAVNPILLWISAVLVMQIVRRLDRSPGSIKPVLASTLFVLFPFFFRAIPWFTALGHVLVVLLVALAAYAGVRAEGGHKMAWWGISLLATAMAPLAHESGFICSVIVGGLVLIEYGVRSSWQRVAFVVLGGLLNAGALYLRSRLPGTGAFDPDGLNSWFENVMFTLHGLVYTAGPAIGWLVHRQGWHDFTLIQIASAALGLLLAWLAVRIRDWRWIARSLWWWAWASIPAAVTFRYGGLVNSPRFYALASVGIVMLWAGAIAELARLSRPVWGRWLTAGTLMAVIVVPNVSFLLDQRRVHMTLGRLYQQILEAADKENTPLGFVNVPAWLAPKEQTYALTKDGMVGLPLYTNVWQFVGVNREMLEVDNVMFVHTLYEPEEYYFGFHGDWLDWEQMRQFAVDHRSLWLTRYERRQGRGRFVLHSVGAISAGEDLSSRHSLARFEGGPTIESAVVRKVEDGHWTVALNWLAAGPVDGNIFVHVVDGDRNLVAQADGPALGGMVPLWVWQPGDCVYDLRHLALPESGGPYTVLVGVYNAKGRFAAFVNGVRQPEDAAPVAEIVP